MIIDMNKVLEHTLEHLILVYGGHLTCRTSVEVRTIMTHDFFHFSTKNSWQTKREHATLVFLLRNDPEVTGINRKTFWSDTL